MDIKYSFAYSSKFINIRNKMYNEEALNKYSINMIQKQNKGGEFFCIYY